MATFPATITAPAPVNTSPAIAAVIFTNSTNCLLPFMQVYKMLTNKESLDQIIVATPGLRSDPVALGKTCWTVLSVFNIIIHLIEPSKYANSNISSNITQSAQVYCKTKISLCSSQTLTCWTCECGFPFVTGSDRTDNNNKRVQRQNTGRSSTSLSVS